MAHKYPEDEFDRLAAERTTTGAHRRPSNARPWLLALLAVLILAPIVGILLGNAMSGSDAETTPDATEQTTAPVDGEDAAGTQGEDVADGADGADGADSTDAATVEPTEEPEPTDEPVAEPDMSHQILVLNGRGTAGFAGENQAILQDQGFGNVLVADYQGGAEPAESTIYYSAPEYEGTAQAAAEALGVTNVVENADLAGAYQVSIVAVMR